MLGGDSIFLTRIFIRINILPETSAKPMNRRLKDSQDFFSFHNNQQDTFNIFNHRSTTCSKIAQLGATSL